MSWKCFDCFRNQVEDVHLLDYQHCMLYDVPIEVFAYERTLEELKLDANRIRDLPRPLFHCHGLKILSLSDNDVQTLPPAVASLINLQQLDLSRNALSAIPDNIKCCKQLHRVDVSINPLEKLPEGFTQLINLEELYLNDTYLDFLPANFGRLTRLKILELRENNLNTLPKSIARLCKLERLDLGQNEFSDMPEAIGSLTNLTELWIDCNRIKSISPAIGNLKKLVHFDASNNNISWISPMIETCERLVDLTLSCNELQEIPPSMSNLKELITLKLDDNQLRAIPSSIGNLSLLQELILSQNNLETLPCTIGLLRQLHILNVDDNILEDLPPEIGSCSSLSLLSVRSNKLQEVPAELGHLQKIKVINLSDNLLRNLPVSILKLTHLNALWLSNNQSTPLTILQKEFDKETSQTVCVNFMLPQTPQDNVIIGQYTEPDEPPVRSRPHIRFAIEAVDEEPNHLLRAPTPYPKELRAMAKHARAIHQGPKRSYKEVSEDVPLLGKMRAPWPNDVQIKEAKVKKPETFSMCEQNKPALFPALSVFESIQETSLHPAENRPIIREAKYVRQRTSANHHKGNSLYDEILPQGHISVPSCTTDRENLRLSIASSLEHPLQPPPYHIAAAYSKQAKWFGNLNSQMRVENWTDHLCYDSVSSNVSESKKGCDKQSATSVSHRQNGSSFHSALEIIGSGNICSWSSERDGVESCEEVVAGVEMNNFLEDHKTAMFEVPSVCVENTLYETCEHNMNIKSDIVSSSSHFEAHGTNYKNEQLGTGLHDPQISSQLSVDNLQPLQHNTDVKSSESDCKSLENLVLATRDTSREHLLNDVDDDLHTMCQMSSLDEELIHSSSLDSMMTGTVPFVIDAVQPMVEIVENHTDCDIANSLNHLLLTSPEIDTRNDSSYFVSGQIKNSRFFGNPPQISSPVSNETSLEVPSMFPMHDSKHFESHYYTFCNGQLLDPNAVTSKEEYGYECGRQVAYNHDVLSPITTLSKGDDIEPSNSIKTPAVQNFDSSYQQNSTLTAIASALKSTKVSASTTTCRGNSKLWRFGLHRNPTVLPILIHKTEDLGFGVNGNVDMSLLPENQKGIFVVSIDPSGPASNLLLPGDKILEVDGTDFSKINYDGAVQILQQTGNVVHMMISRQQ